jgi:two-component system, NarL family, nitrate/nitrite response regulator NarL
LDVRILVADDHDLVREAIAAFLLAEGMSSVTTCANLAETVAALDGEAHNLALVDFNLPGLEGMAGFGRLVAQVAPTPVALLCGSTSRELAEAALDLGGRGFVPKKMAARAMVSAVRLMARGEKFAPLGLLTSEMTPGAPLATLTPREMSVLKGICAGKSNKEIARDLELQEVTVKLHVKTLSRKLSAKNRTHAAMIAKAGGLA